MSPQPDKVLVALSGGVDSAVAAHLLRRRGWDVTGVFLCMGGQPPALADARRVADALAVELLVVDASEDFARIVDYFAAEYARGRTPNPCVRCNRLVKFAQLIRHADRRGARFVATGHHARMVAGAIHRAPEKDQSYALFDLPRELLGRVLLPIGEVPDKAGVRRMAAELGLSVADKPDSQEVCFVDGDYVELLRARGGPALRPGEIVDARGTVLGRHDGVGHFTIGQRRGLRIALGEPYYVTGIDAVSARVTVGPKQEVMSQRLSATGANWHVDPPPVGEAFDAIVQIRYNHSGAEGRVRITGPASFQVEFAEPVAAVTPGQAAVAYDGDRLLGGGWIE